MGKPLNIIKLESQLQELIEKDDNPYLTVEDVAKLIGMDKECLRESIANGRSPFGIGGQRSGGNRFAKIPKLTFYNWYTKGLG